MLDVIIDSPLDPFLQKMRIQCISVSFRIKLLVALSKDNFIVLSNQWRQCHKYLFNLNDQLLCKIIDHLLLNLTNNVSVVCLNRSPSPSLLCLRWLEYLPNPASPTYFPRSEDLVEYYTNISKSVEYIKFC